MNTPHHPWIERFRSHMTASGRYEATTMIDRCELLYRLDRDLPLGLLEATVEELENWLASGRTLSTGTPWSRQSKATYFGHITAFYRWAADPNRMPHLSFDPSTSLSRPLVPGGVPKPCTTDEVARALSGTAGLVHVYCVLSAYAGLRPIQIHYLMREEITEEHLTVKGKGGKTIAIPTHPTVWGAVHGFPRGPIALAGSRRVSPRTISNSASRELQRVIGYPGVTLRRMRHWYATMLLTEKELGGAGANLRTVQELMGHANVATTAIYTKVVGRQRDLAISALPSLVPTPN